jgi:hypothetical protein
VPGERFSTKRPDTFTQTVPSPNFKPLAVRRRTIHLSVMAWFRQLWCLGYPPIQLLLLNCRIAMALSLTDRLSYNLRSYWKLCLSIRKRDWELSDYPVIVRENEASPRPANQRYFALILNWNVAGGGKSKAEALQALAKNFARAKAERITNGAQIPRPGTQVPIEFASEKRISPHSANERCHPAGVIFSTLGAILILFVCYKLKIHFPQINPF